MDSIKVLFLAANPKRTSKLALDEEIREITQKIRLSGGSDVLNVISTWAVRPDDLLQYLNEHKPQVVHFSGHGSPSGEIILVEGSSGRPKAVTPQALKALFSTLKDNIEVVVLNACYSKLQGQAINEVIDFVIGMNAAIGDRAAILFAASFYRALGFDRTVQEAFDQARTAMLLEGIPEENTPVLLVKAGAEPNRRVTGARKIARAAPSTFPSPEPRVSVSISREALRFGITLGWQLARYEFVYDSPFPEAKAIAPTLAADISRALKRDGFPDDVSGVSYHDLVQSVLSHYSTTSIGKHAAILLGIASMRTTLVGASGDASSNEEMARLAYSALAEADPSALPQKEMLFQELIRKKPHSITDVLSLLDDVQSRGN